MRVTASAHPLRWRVAVVAASTFAVGTIAAVAPTPAVVSAAAAPSAAVTTAGQVAATGAVAVVAAPVAVAVTRMAPTVTHAVTPTVTHTATRAAVKSAVRTTTRTRTKAATVTRIRVSAVNPFAFATVGYNQWWAKRLMISRFGWTSNAQFGCLAILWDRESHWNHRAYNRVSGAMGIPQALPGSKMGSVGADWRTNPVTQIAWGLGYVKGRYGTPCSALSHFSSHGWY